MDGIPFALSRETSGSCPTVMTTVLLSGNDLSTSPQDAMNRCNVGQTFLSAVFSSRLDSGFLGCGHAAPGLPYCSPSSSCLLSQQPPRAPGKPFCARQMAAISFFVRSDACCDRIRTQRSAPQNAYISPAFLSVQPCLRIVARRGVFKLQISDPPIVLLCVPLRPQRLCVNSPCIPSQF